ncbi:MAG TPA: MBL fold metallo-hydrolase [Anaerolineales bacterium]|nr:MBL fold metallo-hydrolase [Anaerolineales bacterium]
MKTGIIRLAVKITLTAIGLVVSACNPQIPTQQIVASQSAATETKPATTIPQDAQMSSSTTMESAPSQALDATASISIREATAMTTQMPVKITILYDNMKYDLALTTAWGYSALIEYKGETTLFDTGGDGATLLKNMQILGTDPTKIERVVLSHNHSDHTGGVMALLELGIRPTIYMLPSFPDDFKQRFSQYTTIIEVVSGQSITTGLMTTGEMPRNVPEQALVIETDSGVVVITGCAHPGIVEIVEQVREVFDDPVLLVMGGFHLRSKSRSEIELILRDFRRLGVEQVAPSHCTGDTAIAMFAREYGENFIQAGAGKVIQLGE